MEIELQKKIEALKKDQNKLSDIIELHKLNKASWGKKEHVLTCHAPPTKIKNKSSFKGGATNQYGRRIIHTPKVDDEMKAGKNVSEDIGVSISYLYTDKNLRVRRQKLAITIIRTLKAHKAYLSLATQVKAYYLKWNQVTSAATCIQHAYRNYNSSSVNEALFTKSTLEKIAENRPIFKSRLAGAALITQFLND